MRDTGDSLARRSSIIHGMLLGAVFLLAFAGGLVELWTLRREWLTAQEIGHSLLRLRIGTWIMAVTAWAAVMTFSSVSVVLNALRLRRVEL